MAQVKLFVASLLLIFGLLWFVPGLCIAVSWLGCLLISIHLSILLVRVYQDSSYSPKLIIPPSQRLVVVTSCDSGIALQTAKRLDYAGFHVLACCLNSRSFGARDLEQFTSKRLRVVELDPTNDDHLDRLVQMIEYLTNQHSPHPTLCPGSADQVDNILNPRFPKPLFGSQDGELKLWALVNVPSTFNPAPFELLHAKLHVQTTLESNLISIVRLTQRLLPFLRKSKGRIVNVGSVSGRVAFPSSTIYSMSKSALRSLTDGLRSELKAFQMKCCLVEAFHCQSNLSLNLDEQLKSIYEQAPIELVQLYEENRSKQSIVDTWKQVDRTSRTTIETVVDCIEDAVSTAEPLDEYWAGEWKSRLILWILLQFPVRLQSQFHRFLH